MRDFADHLFQLLLREIDAPTAQVTSDLSIRTAARVALANSIRKKFLYEEATTPLQDELCLEKFLACNQSCREFRLEPSGLYEDVVINQVKMIIDGIFFSGPVSTLGLSDIYLEAGVGPGASIGCESYNFYTKLFDSELTSTSLSLNRLYRSMIGCHPTWSAAEHLRYSTHGDTIVSGSRLSFVPKTSEISRSICTEPVLNMFFQKGIGGFLEAALTRRFNIDLSVQPDLNRSLACEGSVSGKYATIDLSSASDCISRTLVDELFPPYVVRLLNYSRSPLTILPDGTELEMHMISSMGNGFTFPLQTIIFSSLVEACYIVMGLPLRRSDGAKAFGVFGDDIIVEKSAYEFVVRMLNVFGFTVNTDKSFNSGSFRESCGGDYYHGKDIRGVYIKHLRDDADIYSAYNRLLRWSASHDYSLVSSLNLLYWKAKRKLRVPYTADDADGFKVSRDYADVRYLNLNTRSDGYQALVVRKKSIEFPDDVDAQLKKKPYPKFNYNGNGILLGVIAGYIRDGRANVRNERRSFSILWRFVPNWDYRPGAEELLFLGGIGWKAYADAALALR